MFLTTTHEFVGCGSETQLHVAENLNTIIQRDKGKDKSNGKNSEQNKMREMDRDSGVLVCFYIYIYQTILKPDIEPLMVRYT